MNNEHLERFKKIVAKNKNRYNTKNNKNDTGEYKRPAVTNSDLISENPEELKKKLKDYIKIEPDEYEDIQIGTFIRYMKKLNNGRYKYCHGGFVTINKAPIYLILKAEGGRKKISWAVQLQSENIYYKKKEPEVSEKTIIDVYESIKSGEYKLIKTADLIKLINASGGADIYNISNNFIVGAVDTNEDECEDLSSTNSDDEDDSSTMNSDDDSYNSGVRRQTHVELI